jgi:hypothetical protein
MRDMTNAYKILVGKPEGRDHLRPTHRWDDNIKRNWVRDTGLASRSR